MPRLLVRLIGPVLGIVMMTGSAGAQSSPPKVLTPSDLFTSASPAVVTIRTGDSGGSGVMVDAAGVVITNLHVIRGADKATIILANGDAYDDVAVIEFDLRKDLVLLKIKGFKLPAAQLGDSDGVVIGQKVYTIGAPKGLDLTLGEGLVSGMRDTGDGYRVIQTSSPISPGSSGGGLFDERGRLVGITSFKVRGGENLNFALPINYVRGMLATTARMSLSELSAKLKTSETPAESTAPVAREAVTNDGVPRLQKVYRSFNGDAFVVVEQGGAVARMSFTVAATGYVYGTAILTWDPAAKGFRGYGNLDTVCGQYDTRIWKAPVQQEIYVVSDGAIRDRWGHPTKVHCDKKQVLSWTWQEGFWYRPDTK